MRNGSLSRYSPPFSSDLTSRFLVFSSGKTKLSQMFIVNLREFSRVFQGSEQLENAGETACSQTFTHRLMRCFPSFQNFFLQENAPFPLFLSNDVIACFFLQTNSNSFKRQGVFAAGTVFQLVLKTLSDQNCQNLPATVGSMSSDTSLFLMSRLLLSGCLNKYITCRFQSWSIFVTNQNIRIFKVAQLDFKGVYLPTSSVYHVGITKDIRKKLK